MANRNADDPRAFTPAQADSLLSGAKVDHGALSEVAPVLDALRVSAKAVPVPARVDAMATQLAAAVDAASPSSPSAIKRSPAMKARLRIASATGAAIALALGTTGVAAAADQALPGDALYDFKRTLESFGINDGGFEERVDESVALAENGDDEAALEHLADSLEEEGDEEAAEELRKAAQSVLSGGSENSLAVRTAVAEMLQWMADTDLEGRDFGQGVAERARAIGGPKDKDKADDDVVEEEPLAAPEDGVVVEDEKGDGKPETAGPPEDKGKPETAGPPEDKGKPENVGKPDSAGPPDDKNKDNGKPEKAGPPEGKGKP